MGSGWLKFAILGSTYARALENAGTRGGRALSPAMQSKVTQLHAQPQAKLQRGLGDTFRDHARGGELPMTPQRQDLQNMLHKTPWATDEHSGVRGGSQFAVGRFNQLLDETGRSHAQPGVQQAIHKSFGPPPTMMKNPSQVRKLPENAYQLPGGFSAPSGRAIWELQDEPLNQQPTRVGPAPAPTRRTPMAQPPAIQRPDLPHAARGQPAGAVGMAGKADATGVMRKSASLPLAAGIGIPLAIGGGILASKPGIRADLADRFGNPGDIHQKDVAQTIPDEVQGHATRATQALAERGINPAALRIAVDAPSGAGKTVLSKALAQQMGLRHHGLDWRPNLRMHQLMGGGDIEKTPYAPHAGEILEHQQLLRSYDPELFDVAIHIHKDPHTIRQQVLKRGRGARTHDLLDYEKSIGVGRKAFETLGGDAIDLGGGVMMKIRPQGGWGNALDQQLASQGIDPMNLTRHQKLLSLHSGKRVDSGAGWTPYMKSPFTGGETAAMAASIPLGVMAARALSRAPV